MTGHEFVIEGRPKTKEELDKTYYNQRRDRLADSVADYLTCDSTDARQCYEEILSEVDAWIEHHRKGMQKAAALKSLMMGHRDVSMDFPHWPGEVTDKILLTED